jgi:4-hydroxy-tetrahydrodipicolinate synthase
LECGCDGVTLFGTTGEGAEFSVGDRVSCLNAVISSGMDPKKLIISVGAMSIQDVVTLTQHATDRDVHGVLLMPPCIYRSGITESGVFAYFKSVIDRVDRDDLRLYLYHFPDISGVAITPTLIRRLDDRYPGRIVGVKDSGGNVEFTGVLVRGFSHLSIFTGSEIHLPELAVEGLRGTVCGLANVMPRLMREMVDKSSSYDRLQLLPYIVSGDAILSRRQFIPSAKTVLTSLLDDKEWLRVLPPMSQIPIVERNRLVADFRRWDAALPPSLQIFNNSSPIRSNNVVAMRQT